MRPWLKASGMLRNRGSRSASDSPRQWCTNGPGEESRERVWANVCTSTMTVRRRSQQGRAQ
eukprot:12757298-Alexandrium_andersonii.AAC.1